MAKRGPEPPIKPPEESEAVGATVDGLSDGLGTLTMVGNEGKMSYMGRTAKLEVKFLIV